MTITKYSLDIVNVSLALDVNYLLDKK